MRQATTTPLPLSRRLLFSTLALVLAAALLEVGAGLLLSATSGEWFTLEDYRRLRQAARPVSGVASADASDPESDEPRDGDEEVLDRRLVGARDQVLHPFVGYVMDPTDHWSSDDDGFSRLSAQLGFPLNRRDVLQTRAPDRIIVGIFGGSVAAILGGHARRLEALMAKAPELAGREPRVVSLAMAGYKQPQQLHALTWLTALGGQLDVVVEVDGFNDVALGPGASLPTGTSPYFPRGWRFRTDGLDPDQRLAAGEVEVLRRRRGRRADAFSGPVASRSRVAATVFVLGDRPLLARISELEAALATSDAGAGSFQATGWIPEWSDDAAMIDAMVDLWERSARQMAAVARASGARYLHFLQPNQYDPGSKTLSEEEQRKYVREDHPYRRYVELGYPRLRERSARLRDEGLAVFDTTRLFADDARTLYKDACCHYNREGFEILADRVVEEIVRAEGR